MHKEIESNSSEKFLIKEMVVGNERAFEFLYAKYYPPIYAYCFSLLKTREDAEEIVQEVFTKLWVHASDIDLNSSLKAYLYTITKNLSFNYLKKSSNQHTLKESLFYRAISTRDATFEILIDKEYQSLKIEAIELLPEKRRIIYQMSRDQGMSYDDISSELNISMSTVKNQMSKALQFIRKYLQLKADVTFLLLYSLLNMFFS